MAFKKVNGGTLYLQGSTVWVDWDGTRKETWSLPDTSWGREQAAKNFMDMVARWS